MVKNRNGASKAVIILSVCVVFATQSISQTGRITVAVKPLGNVDPALIRLTCQVISDSLGIQSVVEPAAQEPPLSAYYEPRKRYRAEKILDFLEGIGLGTVTKVIGLTDADISTTKGRYPDWGIFGMAYIGGRSCVVSTYRLGRGKVAPALFSGRVKKVVTHELGHLFGLPHCPTPGCVMRDADGKIATIDHSDGRFCGNCRRRLNVPSR